MIRVIPTAAVTALLALAIARPSGLLAQTGNTIHYNLGGGLSLATGDFGDRNEAGYTLIVGAGMAQRGSPIGFRVEGFYNEFSQKLANRQDKSKAGGISGNATWDFSTATGNAFTPYLIGGLGFYSTKEPFFNVANQTNVGFNVGGGLRFPLSGFSAYFEARYHSVSNANVSFLPIVFGLWF